MELEEPVTPMGRLCLLPEHNHVIYCAIGLKNPIDINSLKHEISNSVMIKIPRFSCKFVIDPKNGSERWEKVHVNLEDHIFIHQNNENDQHHDHQLEDHKEEPFIVSDDDVINSYLADMAISSPMRTDKPLWELHVMHEQKCIIMRIHHAVADGMSLMSLLWSMVKPLKEVDDEHKNMKNTNVVIPTNNKVKKTMGLWGRLVYIWHTLVFGLIFVARCLWVKDKAKVISSIEGVEFWPRRVATARFKIADMKTIKKAIPSATVHDVLCGIIWCGLTRYLNIEYPKDIQDGEQITGMCPYNLREQPGVQDVSNMMTKNSRAPWGNKFSIVLLPVRFMKQNLDPLSYIMHAKEVMDRKKHSMEALFSYNVVNLASRLFGSKVAGFFYYNLFCNTSFLLSNIAGPPEEVALNGNPVTFLRITSSAQPHAMTMHMVSYGGNAELQIQVAKEVIPNPKFLAKCFEDALLEMKEAAEGSTTTHL